MGDEIDREIVDEVAAFHGTDPRELEYAVGDHVDLTAVRQLARSSAGRWTLSFNLPDCRVTVGSDGEVTVEARALVGPRQ